MKVFLSWSGELSRELGEALRNWLPLALQAIEPYFTPNDIDKGARWGTEIADELEKSQIGIFCMTRDNLDNPWIMFEAGAISKAVGASRVCPILFNLEPSDVSGPLAQFQLTRFTKEDMLQLLSTVNKASENGSIPDATLGKALDLSWPDLEGVVAEILERSSGEPRRELRSDREVLDEVLASTRSITKHLDMNQSREDANDLLKILTAKQKNRRSDGFAHWEKLFSGANKSVFDKMLKEQMRELYKREVDQKDKEEDGEGDNPPTGAPA